MVSDERIRADYDTWAEAYAEFVGRPQPLDELVHGLLAAFAGFVGPGRPVLDAGCGPGHQTARLRRLGVDACGLDLSPAAIGIARRSWPGASFAVGSFLALPYPDGSFDGLLSHFSLIHTPAERVPDALAEWRRVLRRDAHVLIAFQCADDDAVEWVEFDHRVTPGVRWSIDALASRLADAGFAEVARVRAPPPPDVRFPAGWLLTRLSPAR